jgi:hypothetical protein
MRSFLIGLFAGILLSALRAPVGLELMQLPAPSAGALLAYRAAAMLVVALGLILGLKSVSSSLSPVVLVLGTAMGHLLHWRLNGAESPHALQLVLSILIVSLMIAGHKGGSDVRPRKGRIVLLLGAAMIGWFLIDKGFPKGHGEAILVGLAGLISLAIVGRCTGTEDIPEELAQGENHRVPAGGLSGIAVCGAGIALTLEGLTRNTRLLGGGLPTDDSVFGTVFFLFALVSVVAFTRNIKSAGATGVARAIVGACTAATAILTLRSLSNLSSNRGLDLYLKGLDGNLGEWLPFSEAALDMSTHGMIEYDIAIAGPLLVLPGFLAGAIVGLLRKPVELAALLVGASGGLALIPHLLEFQIGTDGIVQESSSGAVAMYGALLAGVGAALLVFTGNGLSRKQRIVGGIAAAAGILTGQFADVPAIKILSPWERRIVSDIVCHEVPAGLVTIEHGQSNERIATLNRLPLTPSVAETPYELDRIRTSWAMLGELEPDAKPRVLFVGQLDPARALALVDLGAAHIDRTGAWFEVMGRLEESLFDGAPSWFAGDVLSPASARAKLAAGEYDLVIVPAVAGVAPTTRNLASPQDTTVVVWFDASAGVGHQHMGQELLVSVPGLTNLFVAIARGPQVEAVVSQAGWGKPRRLAVGDPVPAVPMMKVLGMRKNMRGDFHRARFADRLAAAELTPGIGSGIATHFHAQKVSSRFSSEIDGIELDEEACQRFSEAASGAEPSALAIELIESLARILRSHRAAEEIDKFIMLPAERHPVWPALEYALAQSSLEFLEPEGAVESLGRVHAAGFFSVDSFAMLADAQSQTGDHHGAAASLDQALLISPHHPELERRLAMCLARAGDVRAKDALRHALDENPSDEELKRFLDVAPLPAPPAGYHPLVSAGAHDHGDH